MLQNENLTPPNVFLKKEKKVYFFNFFAIFYFSHRYIFCRFCYPTLKMASYDQALLSYDYKKFSGIKILANFTLKND